MTSAQPGVAIGNSLSRYRIAALLGEGGMGVVYRARDERLKRDVALKIVAPERVSEEERRRLRSEALALSRLNHPNIQTVYDFDSDGGLDFLVTEYIPGPTLRERIESGPLPADETAHIAAQLADGLAAAHARGIVHRDLKPENLKITPEGRLKILDFGIARSTFSTADNTNASTDVAESPAIIGTLPYMSPEQLRGEPADARSDIFSAGCVLYEMCTGRRAFSGALRSAPTIDRGIPLALQRLIRKCLQMQPRDRYQSAGELAADLRTKALPWKWLAAAAVVALAIVTAARFWPASAHAVAVLPLQNLSGDPQQEYFADGMTDALITDLGRVGVGRVIARGSMMQYKGTKKSLAEIARELHVDRVVSGTVFREGNRVRVTAELIDPSSQTQLWSDGFDRDLRDVLTLQSDLASTIARRVGSKVLQRAAPRATKPEAYDAYLRGRVHAFRSTPQEQLNAMAEYEAAIREDPLFAAPHAAMARLLTSRAMVYAYALPREVIPRARAEALRALELDETSAEAHDALGCIKQFVDWDWSGAEKEFRRAVELDPSYPDGHFDYATLLLGTLRKPDEWAQHMNRCLELDPLNPARHFFRARQLYLQRKADESLAELRQLARWAPGYPLLHEGFHDDYALKGQYVLAIDEIEKRYAADAEMLSALRAGAAGSGYRGAMKSAAELLERRSERRYESPNLVARFYALAGDRENAFRWLERAYREGTIATAGLLLAPHWDGLRDDPRFKELIARMKFPA